MPTQDRSDRQKANLAAIASAARINPEALLDHLNWATWLFQDLVQAQLGGRNPFGPRPDALAVAQLEQDSAPDGHVNVPVLTAHASDDPTAFVELESVYKTALDKAGNSDLLVQTFTDEHVHSYFNDTEYAALLSSLLDWVDHGIKPTPRSVAARCAGLESRFASTCLFLPDYQVLPLAERAAVRKPFGGD